MDRFLKLKTEASGYPDDVVSEEDRRRYVEEYFRHKGVRLDPGSIEKNPGLRSLAKLCLNNFWGKFAQRDTLSKYTYLSTLPDYLKLMGDQSKTVEDLTIVGDGSMLLAQCIDREGHGKATTNTNVVLASYVTAQARLKLYGYLQALGSRALYVDTDSVIYSQNPEQTELPTCVYLGDLTDKCQGRNIVEFVC